MSKRKADERAEVEEREYHASKEPTYTSDEMYEIMLEFATHITATYDLRSKLVGVKVVVPPEYLLKVWQNSLEQKEIPQ